MAQQFSQLLNNILNQRVNWQHQIIADWAQIIGPIHQRVRVEKIENTTLTLGVFDAAWMHELSMLTDVLRTKINTFLGSEQITAIRLRRVAPKSKSMDKRQKPVQQSQSNRPLTPRESASLQVIKDQDLQTQLIAFRNRCLNQSL